MTPSLARINPFQILVIENRPRAPDKSSAICMKRRDLAGDGTRRGWLASIRSIHRTNLLSCSPRRENLENNSPRELDLIFLNCRIIVTEIVTQISRITIITLVDENFELRK